MTARRRSVAAAILACGIGLAACFDEATDPRRTYDLEDASGDLRPQVEEAIASANAALGMENRFVLRATWQDPVRKGGLQQVPVYLLRRRLPIYQADEGIAVAQATVTAFRSALASVTVDPRYEDCKDTDPCAPLMYAGTEIARLASEVFQNFSAVDSAATESGCRCVILMEEDLKRFQLILGPSINDGRPIVPLTWYIPWYALHEVGHLNKTFRLQPSLAWATLYERTLSGLNEKQREEMRSDAYAAATLRQACFFSPQEVRNVAGEACLGLALQALQLWSYALFDKSGAGLKRQYLGDGNTHPNALMRLLAMNVVMTDGAESGIKLLSDFLNNRETFAGRLLEPKT